MNIKQLRYVLRIANRNLNITDVSSEFAISPTGLGKQIKNLEQELGFGIFVRRGKRLVSMTQEGEILVDMIERLLVEADAIQAFAAQVRDSSAGRLAIATAPGLPAAWLDRPVAAFADDFPAVGIELVQMPLELAGRALLASSFSLAFSSEPIRSTGILSVLLHRGKRIAIADRNHPLAALPDVSLSDLARYPLLIAPAGSPARQELAHILAAADCLPTVRLGTDDVSTKLRLLAGSECIAILDEADVPPHDPLYAVLPIPQTGLGENPLWLSVRRGKAVWHPIWHFLNLLARHLDAVDVLDRIRGDLDGEAYR